MLKACIIRVNAVGCAILKAPFTEKLGRRDIINVVIALLLGALIGVLHRRHSVVIPFFTLKIRVSQNDNRYIGVGIPHYFIAFVMLCPKAVGIGVIIEIVDKSRHIKACDILHHRHFAMCRARKTEINIVQIVFSAYRENGYGTVEAPEDVKSISEGDRSITVERRKDMDTILCDFEKRLKPFVNKRGKLPSEVV